MTEDLTTTIGVECSVQIAPSASCPEDWLSRVTVPGEFLYWNANGSPFSKAQGLEMLASCAVRLGIEDACQLDGWGDLERGMLTMQVVNVEVLP